MCRKSITQSWFAIVILFHGANLNAQVRITEILSHSVLEPAYEWVEIENTTGSPISLSGFVFDDNDGDPLTAGNIVADELNPATIPANGLAILYNDTSLGSDPSRFRSAWGLDESVTLIGVRMAPGINNGGDQVGLWTNLEEYTKDLANGQVDRFDNAVFSLDFSEDPFPSPNDASLYYKGDGDIKDGLNWLISAEGVQGAYKSTPTFFQTSQVNSPEDVGNPGKVPAGPAADGLLITEIMFNPKSDPDNSFEYVEIYNNTGSTIDFSTTNYFFDDVGGNALAEPNVTSGLIDDDSVAVLFNGNALTADQLKTAWGNDVNFIPVSAFSALNNDDDQIGLWQNQLDYESDKTIGIFEHALASVAYDAGNDGWPSDNGVASISLSDLNADYRLGANWVLSSVDDGLSANAIAVFAEMVPDHPGGDIGSPGIRPNLGAPSGDFDLDGDLDVEDINALSIAINAGQFDSKFDVNGDRSLSAGDVVFWANSLKRTHVGDANLDGEFGSADLVAVFQPGEYEDATDDNSTWAEGDWNGDLDFNTTDLVVAFQGGGFEAGPLVVNAVPEPTSLGLFVLGLAAIALRQRKQ